MRGDFGAHVGGPYHFKDLGRTSLPDGECVKITRERIWQGLCIPGGAIRFNHADGVIEVWCGDPPADLEGVGPTVMAMQNGNPGAGTLALIATPASPSDLPAVSTIPEEHRNKWCTVSNYIGQPTVKNGAAKTCPFLSSRNAWKASIASPVSKVVKLLNKYNIWPECEVCDRSLGLEEHVPAAKHYDCLTRKLPENVPVSTVAATLWQTWQVPGGAIRFNHLHGRIDIWSGPPPEPGSPEPVVSLVQWCQEQAGCPAVPGPPQASMPAAPAAAAAPTTLARAADYRLQPKPPSPPRFPVRVHNGPSTIESLPEEHVWFQVRAPAGLCTKAGGDWKAYPHLSSKPMWKQHMGPGAAWLCNFLEKVPGGPIWPECMICERSRGFGEHAPAAAHLLVLSQKYCVDGAIIEDVKQTLWQEWRFAHGAIRYNYVDGAIEMCRGEPPTLPDAGVAPEAAPPVQTQPLQQLTYSSTAHAPPPPPVVGPGRAPAPPPVGPAPTVAPTPAVAAPDPSLTATVSLCYYMWKQTHAEAARQVEVDLKKANIPTEGYSCALCEGRSMLGRVAEHLLSPEHVRNVAVAAEFSALGAPTGQEKLEQKMQGQYGQVTLQHLPPRVVQPEVNAEDYVPTAASSSGGPPATTNEPDAETNPQGLRWERKEYNGSFYWQRSDGLSFWENDTRWQRFDGGDVGSYRYNRETQIWFLESGEDKGYWRQ